MPRYLYPALILGALSASAYGQYTGTPLSAEESQTLLGPSQFMENLGKPLEGLVEPVDDPKYECGKKWPEAELPYHWKPNGCGPDKWYSEFIPNKLYGGLVDFSGSCSAHDRCFMTVSGFQGRNGNYEAARADCDSTFRDNMKTACLKGTASVIGGPLLLPKCLAAVETYYLTVRQGGRQNYRDSIQNQMEFEQCVAQHGYHKWEPVEPLRLGDGISNSLNNGLR